MPRFTTDQSLAAFNDVLREIGSLRNGSYNDNTTKTYEIENKIRTLVKYAFDDHADKIAIFSEQYRAINVDAPKPSDEQLQAAYLAALRGHESFVESYVEELKLLKGIEDQAETQYSKLDKTEADITKARNEAIRRGYVVEIKALGGAIEIIDRLRDMLKERTDYSKEITQLKGEIARLNTEVAEFRQMFEVLGDELKIDIQMLLDKRRYDEQQAEEYTEGNEPD